MTAKKLRAKAPRDPARSHYVYVIRLDRAVLNDRRFRESNPQHDPEKPCVHAGRTGRDPYERFAQHKNGYKAARLVRKYGIEIIERYLRYSPMSYKESRRFEAELARRLKKRRFAVWQN